MSAIDLMLPVPSLGDARLMEHLMRAKRMIHAMPISLIDPPPGPLQSASMGFGQAPVPDGSKVSAFRVTSATKEQRWRTRSSLWYRERQRETAWFKQATSGSRDIVPLVNMAGNTDRVSAAVGESPMIYGFSAAWPVEI